MDRTGHFQEWMMPNAAVFYGLVLSALIFPVLAVAISLKAEPARPVLLLFTHAMLSFGQTFFGLLPLIS